jgi:hypothetical protein
MKACRRCQLPGHRLGEPALREAIAGWVQRRYGVALDAATQVLPVNGSREALFAFAQTVIDPTRPAPPWSAPIRSTRSTKARRCWPARDGLRQQRPGAQLRGRLGRHRRGHLGAHAAALRLLAGQPHRRGDAAGRMAAAVRAERPPRLRDRQRRVLLRDLLRRRRRRWAACRPRRRWAARLPQPGGLHQPVQAQQRAGPALGLRRRRRRAAEGLPALPHLPRQRDEPDGAARQHRGLERRGACGGQPRAVPRQVRTGHAAAGAVLDVALPDAGFYLWAGVPGGDDVATSPAACSLNTMCRCCPAACWRAARRASTRAPAESAWRWWPASTNASKPPHRDFVAYHRKPPPAMTHTMTTCKPSSTSPGKPRRAHATNARGARRGRAGDRRRSTPAAARGRAPGRGPSGPSTSGSRRRCC